MLSELNPGLTFQELVARELKARYRELNRALAQAGSESDANAVRRERDLVQEEIRRLTT